MLFHKSFTKPEDNISHFLETTNRTTGKNSIFYITVGSFSHPKEAKNKSSFLHNTSIHICSRRIRDLCLQRSGQKTCQYTVSGLTTQV